MRVYLTREDYRIEEAEGHALTGHPDQIQVAGRGTTRGSRIYREDEWHRTRAEAVAYLRDRIAMELAWHSRMQEDAAKMIPRLRALLAEYDAEASAGPDQRSSAKNPPA